MDRQLERYQAPKYMETLKWQSEVLMQSGPLIPKHYNSVTEVCSVMMLADELGVGRITALRGMYIVDGKVSTTTQLLLALCYKTGQVEDFHVQGDDKSATCRMKRAGHESAVEFTFTIEDAKALGLANRRNWQQQPATMLRWRVIAAVARTLFADAIEGLYTHEELDRPIVVTDEGGIELDESRVTVLPDEGERTANPSQPEQAAEEPGAEESARESGNRELPDSKPEPPPQEEAPPTPEEAALELQKGQDWKAPDGWLPAVQTLFEHAAFDDDREQITEIYVEWLFQPENRNAKAWLRASNRITHQIKGRTGADKLIAMPKVMAEYMKSKGIKRADLTK